MPQQGPPTGLPAKRATAAIPIVFVTGSDPVEQGLVQSLDRPGGNLTGAATLAVELGQKRMELLHEMVPTATLTAVLVNHKGPNLASVSRDLQAAAQTLKLPIHVVHASNDSELDIAFASLVELRTGALVIGTDRTPLRKTAAKEHQPRIVALRHIKAGDLDRDRSACSGWPWFQLGVARCRRRAPNPNRCSALCRNVRPPILLTEKDTGSEGAPRSGVVVTPR